MGRLAYLLALGTIGALLAHISMLFLIPVFAENDAWARLWRVMEPERFSIIEPGSDMAKAMREFDAQFVVAACPFSLEQGPALLTGDLQAEFWSLSVYNRNGENIYSINDRIARDGKLNVAVVTPLQIIELQNDMPEELADSVLAEADADEGFVILRAFTADIFERPALRERLAAASCGG